MRVFLLLILLVALCGCASLNVIANKSRCTDLTGDDMLCMDVKKVK